MGKGFIAANKLILVRSHEAAVSMPYYEIGKKKSNWTFGGAEYNNYTIIAHKEDHSNYMYGLMSDRMCWSI